MPFDGETEDRIEELVDELYAALVDDRDLRFWEGGIVSVAPTGAPPEFITIEIEGFDDQSVMWRGVPASLSVGDEVVVWENPITHRREVLGGSGIGGTSTSSPWQKITVAVIGGDFALLSAAIVWINALPGPVAPSATRLFAINILGGTFVEAADVTIPQWVGVEGEGEETVIDMGDATLYLSPDSSLENIVVTSTGADHWEVIEIAAADNAVMRDVRVIATVANATICVYIYNSDNVELYHVICESTQTTNWGFAFTGSTGLLWDCKVHDTTNFDTALYLGSAGNPSTVTTKFCEFRAASAGDDVVVLANNTWNHFDCQFDPNNVTIAAGTHHALPTKRFNQEVIIAEEGGDFQELSEAIAWINAQGDAAANKLYGIMMLAGNYSEGANVTIPQYAHVSGEGEGTVLDLGNFELGLAADTSLEGLIVTSTGSDGNVLMQVNGDNAVLRDVRLILTGTGNDCLWLNTFVGLELYHVILESTDDNGTAIYCDGCTALLWDVMAHDTAVSHWGTAGLYLDNGADVTTKLCEFSVCPGGDDVLTIAGTTWNHFCTQFDPGNSTIGGAEVPLPHGLTNFADGIEFTGATGVNIVTIPGAQAIGFTLVDAAAVEYLRIKTVAQLETHFNVGLADIDHIVGASVADAFVVRGSDSQVTLGILGAGLIETTAGGVLSSDYTINSTVTMASGQDIDPTDASGQDLGDATHRWDLYTQDVIFGGVSGANVITIPTAQAIGLQLVDTNAVEYWRIDTAPQLISHWNQGEVDIDHIFGASGITNAFVIRGSDGYLGMGVAPSGAQCINAHYATVNTAVDFSGFRFWVTKTAGASDHDDTFYGTYTRTMLDQAAGEISHLMGGLLYATLQDGNVGDATHVREVIGQAAVADLNAGKVWGHAMGLSANVDQEGANEVTGDIQGLRVRVDADGTVGGKVSMILTDQQSGVNYGLYMAGNAKSYHFARFAIGGTVDALAQLHVDQSAVGGAIPVLLLDQADLSEEFIEFTTTVGAGNPIDTAGIGAYYGKARVMVTGVGYKVIALYEES